MSKSRVALVTLIATSIAWNTAGSCQAQTSQASQTGYNWKNVAVGGPVCWVTGIEIHPKAPHQTYIRTDIGGAFRWDAAGERWIALNDQFSFAENQYFGIESLAIDPRNPNAVYIAAGRYTRPNHPLGTIFKSLDSGKSWTKLNLDVPMGGNEHGRQGGERLAISPTDSNVLLFGSRTKGLWRTSDGGRIWKQISTDMMPLSAPVDGVNYGVTAVAFHPTVPGLVYAGVKGAGVYRSTDSGENWNLVPNGPQHVWRLIVAIDGVVWSTHSAGVSKYANSQWANFTPGGKADTYIGLAINLKSAQEIVVSDLGGRHRATDGGRLYRTRDGGATWQRLPAERRTTVPWDMQRAVVNVSGLAFDPAQTNRLWAVDWAGIFRTESLDTTPIVLTNFEKGHEQSAINSLVSPPVGTELLSGFLDISGFRHDRGLDAMPTAIFKTAPLWMSVTTSIAYCEAEPHRMARTTTRGFKSSFGRLALSSDGGENWQIVKNYPLETTPSRVAMASQNPNNMVVMSKQQFWNEEKNQAGTVAQPWQFTRDGGETWQPSVGLPADAALGGYAPFGSGVILVADSVLDGTFYVIGNGRFFRSTDGGANFSELGQPLPPSMRSYNLKAQPGTGGAVWAGYSRDHGDHHSNVRTPVEGLYRSTDGGSKWEKLPNVASAINFAFGKPAPGSQTPTLFLYGRLNGDTADNIYRSLDLGGHWTNITDPNNRVGNQPTTMEGSRQTFGRVFIGTNGRGIFYGDEVGK